MGKAPDQSITKTAASPNPQIQQEALEDWYGRLHNDGSYPQHNGKGPVDEPSACLRMLARHFDLPFRRDVLSRILNDQLKRSGQGVLPLQAVAAICDLLGLRTTGLQPNSADLLTRLPFPAFTLINGRPLLLWQARQQQLLVGDPVAGQRWIDAVELLEQSAGE